MRGALAFGRERLAAVQQTELPARLLLPVGLPPELISSVREQEVVDEPAIDVRLNLRILWLSRAAAHIRHPAVTRTPRTRGSTSARAAQSQSAAQRFLVHVGQMREIQQVVADLAGKACRSAGSPVVAASGWHWENYRAAGAFAPGRIAHPHEELVAQRQRVALLWARGPGSTQRPPASNLRPW